MKIKVLGCSGSEFPGYDSPAFLLEGNVLLDGGSIANALDEEAQFKVGNIFVTHSHLDHIRGIPFLADHIMLSKRGHAVNVLSILPVLRAMKKNIFNNSVWPDFTVIPAGKHPILKLIALRANVPVRVKGYTATPIPVNHSVPAVGYLIEDEEMKRLFYTGDTGPSDLTWKKIGEKKLHGLIIEASFPNKMREMAIMTGHLTAELLLKELLKIKQMPERIYVTHPKPQYFRTIEREIRKLGIRNLRLLKKGETIRI